jgi:hypothetical protein
MFPKYFLSRVSWFFQVVSMSVHETNETELDDRTLLFRRALKKEARIVPDRQNLRGVTREELAERAQAHARSKRKEDYRGRRFGKAENRRGNGLGIEPGVQGRVQESLQEGVGEKHGEEVK